MAKQNKIYLLMGLLLTISVILNLVQYSKKNHINDDIAPNILSSSFSFFHINDWHNYNCQATCSLLGGKVNQLFYRSRVENDGFINEDNQLVLYNYGGDAKFLSAYDKKYMSKYSGGIIIPEIDFQEFQFITNITIDNVTIDREIPDDRFGTAAYATVIKTLYFNEQKGRYKNIFLKNVYISPMALQKMREGRSYGVYLFSFKDKDKTINLDSPMPETQYAAFSFSFNLAQQLHKKIL